MAFLIGGANSDSGAYQIDNSLRFDDGSSCKLEFDTSGDGTATKGTISLWVKRSSLDIMSNGSDALVYAVNDSENYSFLRFDDADKLDFYNITSNTLRQRFVTNRLFRDIAAWYHIVLAFDVSQASSSNGIKIYVNGELQTSFGTSTYNQNQGTNFFLANADWKIGVDTSGGSFFDGYIANVEAITNQQLAATDFGESNDNGVWIPKATSHTAGTNGFKLEFKETGTSANSSGIGADTSGNDNHMSVTNLAATDVTTDTPTNNFCTLNPLHKSTSDVVLSEGNLKMVSGYSSGWQHCAATIAVKNGKWYWEAKALAVAATDKTSIGVFQFDTTDVDFINNTNTDRSSKGISGHGAGTGSYTYAQGDIIMCGMDLDNNKVYWGKNGTWFGTLDPAAGSGSTTQTISNANFCVPAVGGYDDSSWELNFGVPQFSISSGNADANGYGNFEYAVPSGYYALCTKNLAEYG